MEPDENANENSGGILSGLGNVIEDLYRGAICAMLKAYTPQGFLTPDKPFKLWVTDVEDLQHDEMRIVIEAPKTELTLWLAANGRVCEEEFMDIKQYVESIAENIPIPEEG